MLTLKTISHKHFIHFVSTSKYSTALLFHHRFNLNNTFQTKILVACARLSTHLNRELFVLIWQDSVCVHTGLVSVVRSKMQMLVIGTWHVQHEGQRNASAGAFSVLSKPSEWCLHF